MLQLAQPPEFVIDARREAIALPDTTFTFVNDPNQFLLFAQQQNLYVSWIGCQMQSSITSCCAQQVGAASTTSGASLTLPIA